MNFRTIIVFLFLVLTNVSFAQPRRAWIRYYGSDGRDGFSDIYATVDGGYIMCGRSDEQGDLNNWEQPNLWIVRVNQAGDVVWQNRYQLFDEDVWSIGYSIIETDNGDFVVGGRTDVNYRERRFVAIKVSSDGDLIWERQYGGNLSGMCSAVIETKSGEYLLGGRLTPEDGMVDCYAVMVNDDGDVIWESRYGEHDEHDGIHGIREAANDEYILGGLLDRTFALIKIDDEGDVIWQETYQRGTDSYCYSLVSTANGYALGGKYAYRDLQGVVHNIPRLVLVNDNGQLQLDQVYPSESRDDCRNLAWMSDGGFTLVGYRCGDCGLAIRTEPGGDLSWSTDDFPGPVKGVVEDRDGNSLICGFSGFYIQGTLVKYHPERSAPMILEHSPEYLDISVLSGDSVLFSVYADDVQDDSIRYVWTLNSDSISSDTSTVVTFDELGTDTVQCTVSDSALSDSIRWIVHVEEMYIDSYSPQTLNPSIRRNSTIDFSITTRAIEDDPVEYLWLLNDEQIAENDSVTIRFERGREHSVIAIASQGELADSVTWQVLVNDLIVDYMPEQLELSVEVDTTFEFEVFPFNPNDDSLQFLWTLDGDSISDNSWVLVNFDSEGLYNVTAYVSDTTESNSLTWDVSVTAVGVHSDEPRYPDTPTLYPSVPNPFNSQLKIKYSIPNYGRVKLELLDIRGRVLDVMRNEMQRKGNHSLTYRGNNLTSGVYFIRLSSDANIQVEKVLMLK